MLKKKSKIVSKRQREEEPEPEEEETRTTRRGRDREDDRPVKGKKRGSLADAFDDAKASGNVEDGKYAALIIDFSLGSSDKGDYAQVRYEIADEGDFQGEEIVQFYSLADKNGDTQKGMSFLKRDLAILGKGDVRGSELEDALEEIKDDMLGVNISVKNNPPYTNAYLNGLNETDVIDDWKANRPDKPY